MSAVPMRSARGPPSPREQSLARRAAVEGELRGSVPSQEAGAEPERGCAEFAGAGECEACVENRGSSAESTATGSSAASAVSEVPRCGVSQSCDGRGGV